MNRKLAYCIAYIAATESLLLIRCALRGPEPLGFYRPILAKAREKLHSACRVFSKAGADSRYPHLYLPLFDALGSMTHACKSHYPDSDGLLCTLNYLEFIELMEPREGGRSDAA